MLENNGCPLAHSPVEIRNGYGENLYAGWSSSPGYRISIKNGTYAWAKEKPFYQYDTNSCAANKVCGHYTQMVWKDTQHVGCALAHCDASGQSTEILVCHYDPPGNYEGKTPY
jgi:pathogenesis-related protein 1